LEREHTVVTEEVLHHVRVSPEDDFSTEHLLRPLDASFANVLGRNLTLERVTSKQESDFVRGNEPAWVNNFDIASRASNLNVWFNRNVGRTSPVVAERTLVFTEVDTTEHGLEQVARHSLHRLFVTSNAVGGEWSDWVLDVSTGTSSATKVLTKGLKDVSGSNETNVRVFTFAKLPSKEVLREVTGVVMEELEAQTGIRIRVGEWGVDLLLTTANRGVEAGARLNDSFNTGTGEDFSTAVSIDEFRGVLLHSLELGSKGLFERIVSDVERDNIREVLIDLRLILVARCSALAVTSISANRDNASHRIERRECHGSTGDGTTLNHANMDWGYLGLKGLLWKNREVGNISGQSSANGSDNTCGICSEDLCRCGQINIRGSRSDRHNNTV